MNALGIILIISLLAFVAYSFFVTLRLRKAKEKNSDLQLQLKEEQVNSKNMMNINEIWYDKTGTHIAIKQGEKIAMFSMMKSDLQGSGIAFSIAGFSSRQHLKRFKERDKEDRGLPPHFRAITLEEIPPQIEKTFTLLNRQA